MERPDREPDYIFRAHNSMEHTYFWFEERISSFVYTANSVTYKIAIDSDDYICSSLGDRNHEYRLVGEIQLAYHEWLADKAVEEYLLS